MKNPLLVALMVVSALFATAGGCASNAAPKGAGEADYVLVYLKTGPKSATNTPEMKQTIFAGHMSNMKALAAEGKLVIAGPFAKPTEPTWRGIFLMNVPTAEEAAALAATDPGIIGGEFIAEEIPMSGSKVLATFPAIDKADEAERAKQGAQPQDPAKPPPNIRPYVMITAEDFDKARAAVAKLTPPIRTIWSGRFGGSHKGGGVIVLDARKADDVRALLGAFDTGSCVVDGWYSSASLVKLTEPAK